MLDGKKKNPLRDQPCGHKRKPKFSSGRECYIVKLPVAKQIEHFFRHHRINPEWNPDPDIRGDVNTGGCYRQLREEGLIDERTITLQLNTDGAEIFEVRKRTLHFCHYI